MCTFACSEDPNEIPHNASFHQGCLKQGWHRLEKFLNIQDCLEKSMKINLPSKVLEKHSKFYLYHLQEDSTVFLET